MARDLSDTDYYISHGGKIPVKWTAPEVSSFYAMIINSYKYKKQLKLKGEVGMTVLKSTQTRFGGIMYHIHYTSLHLLFSFIMIKEYPH